MKIGLFGGTFDPIHNGHLWIAKSALESCLLDKVIFIPSGISYMKNDVLDVYHRVNMVKLAISDCPKFYLSTIESSKEKNSYSYETVSEYKEMYPNDELFFIIGFDSLENMIKWKNPDIIFEKSTVLVALRGDADEGKANNLIASYIEKFNAKIVMIKCEKIDVSSTQIRHDIKTGLDVRSFLPAKVYDYIYKNVLYKEPENER
ncbi:MAG: nicotinate-nucleotide adenylyltransferase [Lachnospiraceae bacterium]|nr:nicotinate-nucleotide adenylyltransferase [Lachnospiraceae bacterium]